MPVCALPISDAPLQFVQDGHAARGAGNARVLAEHVQATLMGPVEQLLLADYPLRTPPANDAPDPATGFKLDEVSVSLKVGTALKPFGMVKGV